MNLLQPDTEELLRAVLIELLEYLQRENDDRRARRRTEDLYETFARKGYGVPRPGRRG